MGARFFDGADVGVDALGDVNGGGLGRLNKASRGWTSFFSSGDEGTTSIRGVLPVAWTSGSSLDSEAPSSEASSSSVFSSILAGFCLIGD